ncbi:hypothetical protein [Desulfosporosinus orientis]|nr:hypothetical protein [Desulfosporosinus orientis]
MELSNYAYGINVAHGEIAGGEYAVFTVKHAAEQVKRHLCEICVPIS